MTAIVVFSVGFPFSLNDRYSCSLESPVWLTICAIPWHEPQHRSMGDLADTACLESFFHQGDNRLIGRQVFSKIKGGGFIAHTIRPEGVSLS